MKVNLITYFLVNEVNQTASDDSGDSVHETDQERKIKNEGS